MITAPAGFLAGATTAGIKPSGKPDMALVVNQGPNFDAAAVFTRNRVVAAPVKLSRAAVADGAIQAVIYNSGNANACNGVQGDKDAAAMVAAVSEHTDIPAANIAACSTGLIGELLPMEKALAGIEAVAGDLGSDESHGQAAAEAIMTTDTVVKESLFKAEGWSMGAMGKGVGMMAPSLATMLVCVTTDAVASPQALHSALQTASDQTFNTLDVDGSTSTNDTVIILSSGASDVEPSQEELDAAVLAVCSDIADQLQADAEGVTKRVKITVGGQAPMSRR